MDGLTVTQSVSVTLSVRSCLFVSWSVFFSAVDAMFRPWTSFSFYLSLFIFSFFLSSSSFFLFPQSGFSFLFSFFSSFFSFRCRRLFFSRLPFPWHSFLFFVSCARCWAISCPGLSVCPILWLCVIICLCACICKSLYVFLCASVRVGRFPVCFLRE